MFLHRLKANIIFNLVFLLALAMLLVEAVAISTAQIVLLKDKISDGEFFITAIVENFNDYEFGHIKTAGDFQKEVETLLQKSGFSSVLILGADQDEVYWGGRSIIPKKDLVQVTYQAIVSGKNITRLAGSAWGVFWKQKGHLSVSSPIYDGEKVIAGVTAALDLRKVYADLRQSQRIVPLYMVVNLVVLSLAGFFQLSKTTVKPLKHMVKRAESFREDEEGFFLNEEGGSEFTQLSKALNQMLYRISQNKKELKSTVRSLEKANLDLKKAQNDIINAEKMASVGRLSAGIAHEIGNPIAIILGYLELLKQKDISEDQRNDFISRTENEINRVNTIIRQLLDLSRPGGGDLKPVPVHQIISDIVNVFKVQPLASRMRLEIDLSATEDTVKADPSQLRQVFLNLLINAADAISSTGSPEGRLLIMTGVEHGADDFPLLKIMFTDNGPGILQEHLVKIFDPFYTTKPPGKGTGLGLSVCFMIIEALRGKIKADSEPGKGTTMTIHLPLYAGENNDVPHKTAG